jgi:hypothetical protein
MDSAEIPLRDIHLPDPIGWWPLAPGWWIVLGLIVLAMAIALFAWNWRKRRRVRRSALTELTAIEIRFREHSDTHRLAQELSRLARRTALALDPERAGAADTGSAWNDRLDELNETGETDELIKTALARAPYRPAESLDGDALLTAFRPWLARLRTSTLRK